MYDLLLVKKRRRRKVAAFVALFSSLGITSLVIISFLGRSVGTFTVSLKNSEVSLALVNQKESTDYSTYLRVNDSTPYIEYSYDFFRHDLAQIDDEKNTYKDLGREDSSYYDPQAGKMVDGTVVDYFKYTLKKDMNTSSATTPIWFAYLAAVNVLGTPMLFSTAPFSKFMILGSNGTKNSIDKHHIFPKNYLAKIGIDDDRDRNQIANFTYIDYPTNIDIADKPPKEYVSEYRQRLGEEGYKKTCAENALPENFENMEYQEFLEKRRELMAIIIKKGYEKLCE